MAQCEAMAGADGGVREAARAGDPALGAGGDQLARSGAQPGQRRTSGPTARGLSCRGLRRRDAGGSGVGEHCAQHHGGGKDQPTAQMAKHLPVVAGGGSMTPYLDAYGARLDSPRHAALPTGASGLGKAAGRVEPRPYGNAGAVILQKNAPTRESTKLAGRVSARPTNGLVAARAALFVAERVDRIEACCPPCGENTEDQ